MITFRPSQFVFCLFVLGLVSCLFFSSRRRHTRWPRDWSSDVCSSDLIAPVESGGVGWYPSSAADSPGLFSPLNSAGDVGAGAGGGGDSPPDSAAALSLALRRAAGFKPRNCFEWLPGGRCRCLLGVISAACTWPTGPMLTPATGRATGVAGAAATAVAGAASAAQTAIASAARRRSAQVRPTSTPNALPMADLRCRSLIMGHPCCFYLTKINRETRGI